MSDRGDEVLFRVGGILHEARMRECYGNTEISSRKHWPETFKDFRGQRHDGQPWIDVAIAQVRALIKAGLIQSAPAAGASDNTDRRDPVEMPDSTGADTERLLDELRRPGYNALMDEAASEIERLLRVVGSGKQS